jgi:hypothetical protein
MAVTINPAGGGGVYSGDVILYSLAEIRGAQISSDRSPGRRKSLGWCQIHLGSKYRACFKSPV